MRTSKSHSWLKVVAQRLYPFVAAFDDFVSRLQHPGHEQVMRELYDEIIAATAKLMFTCPQACQGPTSPGIGSLHSLPLFSCIV